MREIIIDSQEIPNNPKNKNVRVELDNMTYTITLGRRYIYMSNVVENTGYKVKHSITLLEAFSNAQANISNEIVTLIKETSLKETQEELKEKYIKKLK